MESPAIPKLVDSLILLAATGFIPYLLIYRYRFWINHVPQPFAILAILLFGFFSTLIAGVIHTNYPFSIADPVNAAQVFVEPLSRASGRDHPSATTHYAAGGLMLSFLLSFVWLAKTAFTAAKRACELLKFDPAYRKSDKNSFFTRSWSALSSSWMESKLEITASYVDPVHGDIISAFLHGEALMVTLESRKVYVGFVLSTPRKAMSGDEYGFQLVPVLSGYRHSESMEFKDTTNYLTVIEETINDPSASPNEEFNLVVTIPLSRIVSLSPWDPSVWERFNDSSIVGVPTGD